MNTPTPRPTQRYFTPEELEVAKIEARLAALFEALECQPTIVENPHEDAYQNGRFQGVTEYAGKIAGLIMKPIG